MQHEGEKYFLFYGEAVLRNPFLFVSSDQLHQKLNLGKSFHSKVHHHILLIPFLSKDIVYARFIVSFCAVHIYYVRL